jgi:hypothetical protein
MKSTFLGISLTAAVIGIVTLAAIPAAAQWQSLSWAEAPADNPLKGFMPYQGDGGSVLPHSLEFNYLGMDVLMPADGVVDLSPLEALLVDVASRGRQTVFRVYLDYPEDDNAVPTWLLSGPGAVTQFPYTDWGGGSSPDYDNQRLLTAIETLTAAMGVAYDGDSRLAFVEVGLFDGTGAQAGSWTAPWDLSSIVPGTGAAELWLSVPSHGLGAGTYDVALRVTNVMPGGRPLRFANATQGPEWLSLGSLEVIGPVIVVFVDGFNDGTLAAWTTVVSD